MERRTFILGIPFVLASRPLWAHHGWSSFDETRPIYLAGKAARVRWQNPHAELILELANPLVLPANLKTLMSPNNRHRWTPPASLPKPSCQSAATPNGKSNCPR